MFSGGIKPQPNDDGTIDLILHSGQTAHGAVKIRGADIGVYAGRLLAAAIVASEKAGRKPPPDAIPAGSASVVRATGLSVLTVPDPEFAGRRVLFLGFGEAVLALSLDGEQLAKLQTTTTPPSSDRTS